MKLSNKVAVVTGASKGIGAAAAEAFAEEGCDVLLAARSGDALKALTERLRSILGPLKFSAETIAELDSINND